MSKTKVIIYWTVKGLKIRNKISDYFKLPLKITVNGETYCEVDDSLIEKLKETEKKGLIQIRNKKWK